jgi:type II secretory pathway component HofQ
MILAATCLLDGGASAAPKGLPDKPLDLELKAVPVDQLFKLLADVSQRKVTLDPCVKGTVDLRLKNTPIPLVFDALAAKLHLVYSDANGSVRVGCEAQGAPVAVKLGERVSVTVKDAPLAKLLDIVAAQGKLAGVDYRTKAAPNVTVTLDNVRLSTLLSVLSDQTGLGFSVSEERLVVTD